MREAYIHDVNFCHVSLEGDPNINCSLRAGMVTLHYGSVIKCAAFGKIIYMLFFYNSYIWIYFGKVKGTIFW